MFPQIADKLFRETENVRRGRKCLTQLKKNVLSVIFAYTFLRLLRENKRGFTLVELMLVVAILGILLAICAPAYGRVLAKARAAQTIGNLAILRMALSSYYADKLDYPSFPPPYGQPAGYSNILEKALVPNYIDKIPAATLDGWHHPATNQVYHVWNMTGLHEDPATDTGAGWRYDANPYDTPGVSGWPLSFGSISVLCDHQNSYDRDWQTY